MRVVLLGDSHLARVRRDLVQLAPPGVEVVIAALGGACADDLLHQAAGVPIAAEDVVVVSVGTNDAAANSPGPEATSAALRTLVAAHRPHRWVLVLPPGIDVARHRGRTPAAVTAHGEAAAVVLLGAGARVVDTPTLLAPLGRAAFDDDGLHLSGRGYAVLLPAIAAAVS